MKEEHKVWIRGVNGRGDEVIKALEERGAKNGGFWECNREELIYFINHDGYIDSIDPNCEPGRIIIDNYSEIKLPEKWKPSVGDRYWIITTDGVVGNLIWNDDPADNRLFNLGNYFRTREEALAMVEKIKKLLNAKS